MPTITENKHIWDGHYKWDNKGDEWSSYWGEPGMQWFGSLRPRIQAFVPTHTILEIAGGYGRWTQFLKGLCQNLVVVDLSEECVQASQKRFVSESHIKYFVNDGKSLDMIEDNTIDFVFSYDSLVHADETVMKAYISQLPRILKKDGAAFLHHSNLGEYARIYSLIRKIPKFEVLLKKVGILENDLHWRDFSVSAKKVARLAEEYGLGCLNQETFPWAKTKLLIDCMSIITKNNSSLSKGHRVFRNPNYMKEAHYLSQLSQIYSPRKIGD